jgi:predicted DNA-binding mobile mystery protein A
MPDKNAERAKQRIIIDQLDATISQFAQLQNVRPSLVGWIKSIRLALNMSLRQLIQKLGTTIPSTNETEKREMDGSITIRKLKEVAQAMDMQFVYGFIPKEGSLKAMIEKRAEEIAREIVLGASQNMALENHATSDERKKKAIAERAEELKNDIPKL